MDHGNFNLEKQVATEDTEVSEKSISFKTHINNPLCEAI